MSKAEGSGARRKVARQLERVSASSSQQKDSLWSTCDAVYRSSALMAVKDSLQREDESDGEDDGEDLSQHMCEGNVRSGLLISRRSDGMMWTGGAKCCCWKLLPSSASLGWTGSRERRRFRAVPSSPCRRGEDRVVQLRFVL